VEEDGAAMAGLGIAVKGEIGNQKDIEK